MTEQHDQDEELMRAKLFASMKKKTPTSQDAKKSAAPPDPKPNTADSIVIKSFDQIMREKKANDNNANSSDEQAAKEKVLNRKRAFDLKNRQRELALSRKQAKVAATSQTPAGESSTVAITRAKRAGQPVVIRARLEKIVADASSLKPAAPSHPAASSTAKSPAASQAVPSSKLLQNDDSVTLNSDQATSSSPEVVKPTAPGSPKQPYEQHLEALRREIELANRIIDEFAQMDIPEFSDLNLDLVHDDDQKFIESMSTFLAGTVS